MLRKAENIYVSYPKFGFTQKKGARITVHQGRATWTRQQPFPYDMLDAWLTQQRNGVVVFNVIHISGKGTLWMFRDRYYWETEGLSDRQVYALLVQRELREQRKVRNAEAFVFGGGPRNGVSRQAIPDDVKQAVWVRDGGQCVLCGSRVELQYGHIIPVVLGGGDGANNIQIECGPCNRRKGGNIV
jgi:hypothetical protein